MRDLINKDILIIEDQPEMQVLLKKVLEPSGARIHMHHCVKDGLEWSQNEAPHIVLLDINLSNLSGLDYFKVRANFTNLRNVPVIVVSGAKDQETISQAIALGAIDYVLKPFKASILVNKICKQLADSEIMRIDFESKHGPLEANIFVKGNISGVSPIHIRVEAPIKLSNNQVVKIESGMLSKLNLDNVKFKTTGHEALCTERGRFQKSLQFVGITASQAKDIRTRIGQLKA